MPKATLPTSLTGWIVALGCSFIGFLAGFLAIQLSEKVIG